MASKYDRLGDHLAAIGAATIILTFAEVEAVVGPLPQGCTTAIRELVGAHARRALPQRPCDALAGRGLRRRPARLRRRDRHLPPRGPVNVLATTPTME
jgi:hypothetical protein